LNKTNLSARCHIALADTS